MYKQQGINTYLTINKSIDDAWSENNISCSYEAYAEYGAKLDYNNSDPKASYELALAYATSENAEVVYQDLGKEGLVVTNDKGEIDWDNIIAKGVNTAILIVGGIFVCALLTVATLGIPDEIALASTFVGVIMGKNQLNK